MIRQRFSPEVLRHLVKVRKSLYRSGLTPERRLTIIGTWALRNASGHVVRCTPEVNENGFAHSLGKPAYQTEHIAKACAREYAANSDEVDPPPYFVYECDHGESHWHIATKNRYGQNRACT